ncbi:TonB-dependent receptor [Sphingobium sp. JS3065]|uniref:TonB-dependent receptor n=1 Tax=Sphingobium sp. JS3065 TaxID=2970925 RepID=UPI0022646C41|nr:TonB-dependent receptor [Sphingobium sp. JS3065]UZW54380.1 TonB-dependent receptor [Sphingobium sp. JS3065]
MSEPLIQCDHKTACNGLHVALLCNPLQCRITADSQGRCRMRLALTLTACVSVMALATAANAETESAADAGSAPVVNTGSGQKEANTDAAQSATESMDVTDIVVTASKQGAQTLLKAPLAIQAFSGEMLKEKGVADVGNLILAIPGASISQETAAGIKSYSIRGVGANGTNGEAPIGYYLDDTPFVVTNFGIAPPIRFLDIERVEVLRGPQGTLYGQGSAGGTMIFHTRQPDLESVQVIGEAAVSNTRDASGLNWDFSGAVSVPLIKDVLAIRASGGISRQQGYADVYYGANDGSPDETNVNRQKMTDWRIAVLFKPASNITLRGQVWQFRPEQRYQSIYSSVKPYTYEQTAGIKGFTEGKYTIYSLVGDVDLDGVTLTSSTSYLKGTFGYRTPLGVLGVPGGKFDSFFFPKNFGQEVRARSNGTGPFHWVVGATYQDGEGPQSNTLDFVVVTVGADTNAKTKNWATFGEISYDLFDGKLVPLVGLRYYHDRRAYVDATTYAPSTLKKTTWRANLSYFPNDNLTMFATVSTGFRVNTIQSALQAQLLQADGISTSVLLDPLSLTNYEAGIKARLFGGSLSLAANVYHIDFKGLQTGITSSAGIGGFAILGSAHSTGVDLDATWRTPLKGLTLSAIANVNSSKFDEVNPGLQVQRPQVRRGAQLTGTPKYNFRLDATYERAVSADLNAFANVSFSQTASRPTINDVTAKAYEILGASIGVRHGPYEFAIFGNNLTDQRGPTDYFGPTIVNGPIPRTVGVRLRKSY